MSSLDPRINRLDLVKTAQAENIQPHQHWETYEVFVQAKRGGHHTHAGSLHAADHDMALIFAKEQFARRGQCHNIWVVKTSNIFALNTEDADMFAENNEKKYRNTGGFKVSDKITQYKRSHKHTQPDETD
ncbi:1,2-phenylacetyl-CoA epoxidase subunit B [Sphingobacteriales bacterium UPWRP_1]|nr:1,2-phenylacetyl-CoA epoxidase subunit B [Sphingobacteriales bacterium TSM_CSS]PSJ75085.1 1,2-phenylacetyl-CoA epoxidase subunit B [Sphingobacteriales bacterium UPWRP_1]